MTITNQYEDIHFHKNINRIVREEFPLQYEMHWHRYVEILACMEQKEKTGFAEVRLNQTLYRLEPGDILFIWPGELHEVVWNEEKIITGIQFYDTLFNGLPDFSPYQNLFRKFHLIRQEKTPAFAETVLFYLGQILDAGEQKTPFHGVEELIHLYELFMEFGSFINDTLLKETMVMLPGNSKSLEKVMLACRYISENCEQSLTLEKVSNYVGFSDCYFSRIFKQATGYPFVEYLMLQRVKKAQFLLADGNLVVTEISFQAGFKSISTFNRVFKHYAGCSPREYRKYFL